MAKPDVYDRIMSGKTKPPPEKARIRLSDIPVIVGKYRRAIISRLVPDASADALTLQYQEFLFQCIMDGVVDIADEDSDAPRA